MALQSCFVTVLSRLSGSLDTPAASAGGLRGATNRRDY